MKAVPSLPPGERIELPGRGPTFVRDFAGPPGAPAVILLHGLLATADLNWSACYSARSRHVRVVAVDHRGHGRGIRSRERFRLEHCADDAVAVADILGLRTFVPVGYSMGGPIAQLVWHRHPARVDGLVLCATSRNFRGHPRDHLMFGSLAAANVMVRLTRGGATPTGRTNAGAPRRGTVGRVGLVRVPAQRPPQDGRGRAGPRAPTDSPPSQTPRYPPRPPGSARPNTRPSEVHNRRAA